MEVYLEAGRCNAVVVGGLPERSKALDLVPRHYGWGRGDPESGKVYT